MFRLCEFSRNHGIGQQTAVQLYQKNLDIISQFSNTIANKTTITIGESISTTESLTDSGIMRKTGNKGALATPVSIDSGNSGSDSSDTGDSGLDTR